MTIPQDAIEAAAIIVSGDTEKWFYEYPTSDSDRAGYRRTAHKALTAAMPALEQQIRGQVAQELAAEATRLEQTKHLHNQDQALADALVLGVRHAAKFAVGKEQT